MFNAAHPVKTMDPVGTPQELVQIGISPARYASCSVPSPGNIGCPYLGPRAKRPCEMSFAGKPVEEGGGPRYGGVAIRDTSTGSSNVVEMTCYHYMAVVHNHRAYDPPNLFEWMYSEGETIHTKGSEEQVVDDGTGKKHIVVTSRLFAQKVPIFPRPKDNPVLQEEVQSGELMTKLVEKTRLRRISAAVGVMVQEETALPPPAASALDAELEAITAKAKRGR